MGSTELKLELSILEGTYGVCRLERSSQIPDWALQGSFTTITKTLHELSVVCSQELIPEKIRSEKGWKVLMVKGPLEFSLTGVLANLSSSLADAGISIFAISTYDTDYLLVKSGDLRKSISVLIDTGHKIIDY